MQRLSARFSDVFRTAPRSKCVRLRGDNGFEVRLISYGAALQSIFVPDRAGRVADVVLGRDDLAGYVAVRHFLGATIGRYANRIANGAFDLDGQRFQLTTDDDGNTLHGGLAGFDRKTLGDYGHRRKSRAFCDAVLCERRRRGRLSRQLQTDLTYRISGGTELSVDLVATTDKPTVVNLTNHSFFNLGRRRGRRRYSRP